jgi:hypothetical protein
MSIKPQCAGREKLGQLWQRGARLGWLISVHEGSSREFSGRTRLAS